MTVTDDNGTRKLAPTDKLFVIDLKANPPKLAQTVVGSRRPVVQSEERHGVVANRADGTISVLKIDGTNVTQTGTVQISPGVSHVVFAPDNGRSLKSPDNKVALLEIDGDKVATTSSTFRRMRSLQCGGLTRLKLAITADNGTRAADRPTATWMR